MDQVNNGSNGNMGATNANAASSTQASSVSVGTSQSTSTSNNNVPGSTSSQSSTNSTPSNYKVNIDGEVREITLDDLIAGYQKVSASDKRFQEAANLRKEAEKYQKAINNLESMIKQKDFDKFSKVVGEDFLNEYMSAKQVNENYANGRANKFSDEDVRLAQELGVEVSELINARSKASGTDIPVVNNLMKQNQEIMEKYGKMAEYIEQLEREVKVSKIEDHFNRLKSQYPDADPSKVLDIIERENKSLNDFETVFKIEQEMAKKRLEEAHNKYIELKKKEASNAIPSPNFGGASSIEQDMKGLTGEDKKNKLKDILRNLGK